MGEEKGCITDVPGIKVGHFTDRSALTGCTVILSEMGAIAGVDVRGGFPGTRDTALLDPSRQPTKIHAVLLSGGTNFGLDAAGGVGQWLEERAFGNAVGKLVIPIVVGAVIFDLGVGRADRRPGFADGYAACAAGSERHAEEGNVGVGTGATAGKLLGMDRAMKGGFGTASIRLGDDIVVGAAFVTNPIGNVFDPTGGQVLVGPLSENGRTIVDSMSLLLSDGFQLPAWLRRTNTTLGVVATNARLDAGEAARLASIAHDAIAMTVRPAHTDYDGDTVFCLSTARSSKSCDMVRLGAAVVSVAAHAIANSVRAAESIGKILAFSDLKRLQT